MHVHLHAVHACMLAAVTPCSPVWLLQVRLHIAVPVAPSCALKLIPCIAHIADQETLLQPASCETWVTELWPPLIIHLHAHASIEQGPASYVRMCRYNR